MPKGRYINRPLTFGEIEQIWIDAGGDKAAAPLMAAIALSQSGGRPWALNNNPNTKDYSTGLWQINYYGSLRSERTAKYGPPEALYGYNLDAAMANARAAVSLYDHGRGLAVAWRGDPAYESYASGGSAGLKSWLAGRGINSKGSFSSPGFVSPLAPDAKFERIDQGVDYMQSAPYKAIANGTVYALGSGFHGGTGQAVYIKLDHPITVNGRTYDEVYYAETTPLVKVGQHVKAGQAVASGGAAEIGWANGARPLASLGGGYGPATAQSQEGHDFYALITKSPNASITVGGAPDISTVTASHHQGLTSDGLGAGFAEMPDEASSQFSPQTPQNQEGAFGLGSLSASGFSSVANIWQEIAQQQNSSPESRLLANNAQYLTQNVPQFLK